MAVSQSIIKKFTPNRKDVSYLAKNFSDYRQALIEFAKTYYPNTYSDFNEASPGMMFMEMAAYVGDVMSFYIDNQFKENLLLYARERKNVISIAQAFGYKPRLAAPATVEAKIYQTVPALGAANNYDLDSRYFLTVLANSKFSTNTPPIQSFRSTEDVNFADPENRTVQVFARDANNAPTTYIVSKPIKLVNGELKTATFTFGSAQKFSKVELPDTNVISIISVIDADSNTWYEVDYLGQDVVIDERDNLVRDGVSGYLRSTTLNIDAPSPSKLAIFRKKPRRYATRINADSKMELLFGSGTDTTDDSIVTLNSTQVANNKYNQAVANTALDPSDFLAMDSFGLAPSNTTLTVSYLVGGGVESNVNSGTITNVDYVNVTNKVEEFDPAERPLYNQTLNSVAIMNEDPARGGGSPETVEEIRQNALAFFNAQNRVVTDKDYLVRTLAMPPKFGSIAKAFVVKDEQINAIAAQDSGSLTLNNDDNPYNNRTYVLDPLTPNSINIYLLGYNANKKLSTLNSLVKNNLAKYLEQYRVLTDEVSLLDAFVVNIGVEFNIVVYKNYNMKDVLARCIDEVKDFFDIDKWQINQPIILNDLRLIIGATEGVQSVTGLQITNKYLYKDGRDYQEYRYPIEEAIIDDVIYPSLDPCIFELRYPETDIIGNARQ